MNNMRVLIADDEELCREKLRQFLAGEPSVEIVAECANGKDALMAIRAEQPDIAFLDIKMPELSGFGVVENLNGSAAPAIVFVSAFDSYASEAFVHNAVDYLLKPFDRERFRKALARARQRVASAGTNDAENRVRAMLEALGEKTIKRLTVKSGDRFFLIDVEEIDWVAAADNYVELHVGKVTHLLRMSLMALEKQLPMNRFVRVSRSALVNYERVRQVQSRTHGDALVTLSTGATVMATRTFRHEWKTLVNRTGEE